MWGSQSTGPPVGPMQAGDPEGAILHRPVTRAVSHVQRQEQTEDGSALPSHVRGFGIVSQI